MTHSQSSDPKATHEDEKGTEGEEGKGSQADQIQEDQQRQSMESDRPKSKGKCLSCCFWLMSVLVAGLAIGIGLVRLWSFHLKMISITQDAVFDVGIEGVNMFRAYDRDDDGYLSIDEFGPIFHMLNIANGTVSAVEYEQYIEHTDNVVTIRTHFEPFNLSSLSKDLKDKHGSLECLHGLKNWKTVHAEWRNFATKHFQVFAPPDHNYISLGRVYEIIKFPAVNLNTPHPMLTSNRYDPPKYEEDEITFQRLLSMFHPRPFLHMRFPPQGGYATVRAFSMKYVEIVFRIHAEFQLNEPPYHPYWFTPAQFTGNIIMSRDGSEVKYFNMYVPNDRRLNVDMEWLISTKQNDMEVDIGYIPRMELKSVSASKEGQMAMMMEDMQSYPLAEEPEHEEQAKDFEWFDEISKEEAMKAIEVQFYPFKTVEYYNFTDVFDVAKKKDKLVHMIMLWGALDDQSC